MNRHFVCDELPMQLGVNLSESRRIGDNVLRQFKVHHVNKNVISINGKLQTCFDYAGEKITEKITPKPPMNYWEEWERKIAQMYADLTAKGFK